MSPSLAKAERLIADSTTDALEAMAFNYMFNINDIYSSSWGPEDNGVALDGPGYLTQQAFQVGVTKGRQGRGSIFVFASGNGGLFGDNCNFDGYANSPYTIAIGAVAVDGTMPSYGEQCAAHLAVTYSGNSNLMITTTDVDGECTKRHSGTSAAAPLAAGMFALMLSARPALQWRDIQYIIVKTAKETDPTDIDWQVNGAGFHVSHKYGFGMLDADALVSEALIHQVVPSQPLSVTVEAHLNMRIPYGSVGRNILEIPIDVSKESTGQLVRLEHVQVTVRIYHLERRYLTIKLVSPSGTISILASERTSDVSNEGYLPWTFTTVRCWGEPLVGRWILQIVDSRRNSTDTSGSMKEAGTVQYLQLLFSGICGEDHIEIDPVTGLSVCTETIRGPPHDRVLLVVGIIVLLASLVVAAVTYAIYRRRFMTSARTRYMKLDSNGNYDLETATPDRAPKLMFPTPLTPISTGSSTYLNSPSGDGFFPSPLTPIEEVNIEAPGRIPDQQQELEHKISLVSRLMNRVELFGSGIRRSWSLESLTTRGGETGDLLVSPFIPQLKAPPSKASRFREVKGSDETVEERKHGRSVSAQPALMKSVDKQSLKRSNSTNRLSRKKLTFHSQLHIMAGTIEETFTTREDLDPKLNIWNLPQLNAAPFLERLVALPIEIAPIQTVNICVSEESRALVAALGGPPVPGIFYDEELMLDTEEGVRRSGRYFTKVEESTWKGQPCYFTFLDVSVTEKPERAAAEANEQSECVIDNETEVVVYRRRATSYINHSLDLLCESDHEERVDGDKTTLLVEMIVSDDGERLVITETINSNQPSCYSFRRENVRPLLTAGTEILLLRLLQSLPPQRNLDVVRYSTFGGVEQMSLSSTQDGEMLKAHAPSLDTTDFNGDMERISEYNEKKSLLVSENERYLEEHPELQDIISDYLQFILLKKPVDVYSFTQDYFRV
ncbi:Proprotein convertase subtilisin/kexin type 7 [Gonapodya sp. JEL0774]|nr:Proprotein convertase subtilisin/kexin type 7 [Gonapodya sp. JEL0774]